MVNDGKQLEIAYTMTDPENWEGEWKSTKRFNRVVDVDIQEVSCLPDLERAPAEHDVEDAGLPVATEDGDHGQAPDVGAGRAGRRVPAAWRRSPRRRAGELRRGSGAGRYHEDQPDRVPGEEPGDFSGIPLNDAGAHVRRQLRRGPALGARAPVRALHAAVHVLRAATSSASGRSGIPIRRNSIAIQMYLGTYQQRRTIWMDGRPHPPDYAPHTFMGFSTGEWNGDILTITTTHIKQGYFRRSGVPASDRTTVVEHWMRHGDLLSQVTIATDPVYLTEPYIRSQEFVLMERGNQNWLYNCEYAMEVPRDKNVGAALPARQEPVAAASSRASTRCRSEGVRGGAETLLPEWKPGARRGAAERRRRTAASRPQRSRSRCQPGDVRAREGAGQRLHDRRRRRRTSPCRSARTASRGRYRRGGADRQGDGGDQGARRRQGDPLDHQHVVGRRPHRRQRAGVEGRPHGQRQSGRDRRARERRAADERSASVPDAARPFNTYFEESRDFPFNGEPVVLYHNESRSTDARHDGVVPPLRRDRRRRRLPHRQLSR